MKPKSKVKPTKVAKRSVKTTPGKKVVAAKKVPVESVKAKSIKSRQNRLMFQKFLTRMNTSELFLDNRQRNFTLLLVSKMMHHWPCKPKGNQ